MQTPQRTQRAYMSAIDGLIRSPQAYEFMQAVRLTKHYEAENKLNGQSKESYTYPYLKFKSSLSLAFPVAEIESLKAFEAENIADDVRLAPAVAKTETSNNSLNERVTYITGFELCPAMLGLTGPCGTLPYIYTQSISSRSIHYRDRAAPAFLDIFNHRLTEQYVDASWFYSLPLQHEISHGKNSYIACLRALASQPITQASDLDAMVSYTGLLRPSRLTAEQVGQVLTAYFQVDVSVEQFIPEWFDLPNDQQTSLGRNNKLGEETFLGSRVLQLDTKVRICFEGLDKKTYLDLLPDGGMTAVVFQFLRQWCGSNMAVEMLLELDKSYIKPLSLNESDFGALGRGAFLVSHEASNHSRDTRFDLAFN